MRKLVTDGTPVEFLVFTVSTAVQRPAAEARPGRCYEGFGVESGMAWLGVLQLHFPRSPRLLPAQPNVQGNLLHRDIQ